MSLPDREQELLTTFGAINDADPLYVLVKAVRERILLLRS